MLTGMILYIMGWFIGYFSARIEAHIKLQEAKVAEQKAKLSLLKPNGPA